MKLSRNILAVALLGAIVAPAAHAEIAIDVIGGSEITFEGLVQADYNKFNSDVANLNADAPDGTDADQELRRAELVLKGKGPGNIEWVIGYDAKADKWLDVNAKYKLGGDSNHYLQLGQFKQPNSLEELSSTKNNDFISKAMVTNTFAVARRLGAGYTFGTNDYSLTASYFGRELTRNLAHGSGYGLRGTWAPINDKGNVLHLGLSYVNFDTDADTLRYRARPDADLAGARLVDTGNLTNTDRVSTIGLESFYVHGPLKLQGEYMKSDVSRYGTNSDDFSGTSGYLSGVYNITGETWGYKAGVPTTGLPDDPATGMWQVGLRYDTMDLDDGRVLGGQMDTVTAGVNWYWRSNFKFMLNYVKATSDRRGVSDDPSIIEGRVQFFW
ncbi:OprO/OprP family phosphate-selective porin [Montanilutibacter psychrotolerans]|uniref:Porin n=1 Tax=Montanilutibacter psychrotolerans TaxID=1327343 RepID=A0A3M8SUN7_9GAMM|nr:OprO/OprP family phosphate-selective porin [Lysobacter psychrotolerans]RNF85058.1 porin [Lysobacter psychrotolerans]